MDKKIFLLPFTTAYQKETQKIIKELWHEEDKFLNSFTISLLNEQIIDSHEDIPILDIYYTDKDENIFIKIKNHENYYFENTTKISCIGIEDDKELLGISLYAIIELNKVAYLSISRLHKDIIDIYKSNLSKDIQKSLIQKILNELDHYISKNSYKLNSTYPTELIKNLNNMHLVHEWIDKDDSLIIQLALEAYQEIIYYEEWIDKHKIEEKKFKEKIITIKKTHKDIAQYMGMNSKISYKLPKHPQDIVHSLVSNYCSGYGEKRNLDDEGVFEIIKQISRYVIRPKKSKMRKIYDEFTVKHGSILSIMQETGKSYDEILNQFIWEKENSKQKK